MKHSFALGLSTLGLALAAAGNSQIAIGPFVGADQESFDLLVPGSYGAFVGFAGAGTFVKFGGALGALVVNNAAATLNPRSVANDMYGLNANVKITFSQVRHRFGGYFRTPALAGVPTQMFVAFYRAGVLVGVKVGAPVDGLAWRWRGWDVTGLGGYDEVRITGNAAAPGKVGMDDLQVD